MRSVGLKRNARYGVPVAARCSWRFLAIIGLALVNFLATVPAGAATMMDASDVIAHPLFPAGIFNDAIAQVMAAAAAVLQALHWVGSWHDWLWVLGLAAAGIAFGSAGRGIVIYIFGHRPRKTPIGKLALWVGRELTFFVCVALLFVNLPPWPRIHGLAQTIAICFGVIVVARGLAAIVLRIGHSRNYAIVRAVGNATVVLAIGYIILGLMRLSQAPQETRVLAGLVFWLVFVSLCATIIVRFRHVTSNWRTIDIVVDPVSTLLLGQRSLFFGLMLLMICVATIISAFSNGPRAYVDGILSVGLLALLPTAVATAPGFIGKFSEHFGPWQKSMVRCARLVVFIAFWAGLASIWDVTPLDMASSRLGPEVGRAAISICIAIALAYLLWEVVGTSLDTIALPHQSAIPSEENDHRLLRATRLQTFIPLLRALILCFIVAATGMIALAAMGVNIGPLLAGAGIVGVAIGFGSQSLVKDVISGIFFLADDAFRIGEYVEVSSAKGTVEAITIRSLKLRHPRGALYTVPFGSISMVNNQSRDYVIVKLEFLVTFEADLIKAKKLIKELNRELESDEELAGPLLQPIKFQGVRRMEQYGMVVGVKFTARPNEQWVLRREVFRRVRDAFQAAGISFARPQVIVQVPDDSAHAPPSAAHAAAGFVAANDQSGGEQSPTT